MPSPSIHVQDKWASESGEDAISLTEAWHHGTDVGDLKDHFGHTNSEADELRIYAGITTANEFYVMAIIRIGNTLVTTYSYDGTGNPEVDSQVESIISNNIHHESSRT